MSSARTGMNRAGDRGTERDESHRKVPSKAAGEAPPMRRPQLNEYWIDGEGINRQVLQMEICKYLGNEATCRPGDYEGRAGFKIRAVRPFTPDMLDDLKLASRAFMNENKAYQKRHDRDLPYEHSQTYENGNPPADYPDRSAYQPGRDSPSYAGPSAYGVPSGQAGFPPTTAGYPGASTYAVHSGIPASSPMPVDPRFAPPPQGDYGNYPMAARDGRDGRDPRGNGQYGAYPANQYVQAQFGNDPYRNGDPRGDPRMAQQDGYYAANGQYGNNGRGPQDGYYDAMSGVTGPNGGYGAAPARNQMSPQYEATRQEPYRAGGPIDPRYRR